MTHFANVDEILRAAVGDVFPAAQLVVVDRFSLVYAQAVGDCTSATLFDVASLTKALATAALTMMALEEGAVALEDRPRPELTVAQLLSHASGLPAWRPLYERGAAAATAAVRAAAMRAAV